MKKIIIKRKQISTNDPCGTTAESMEIEGGLAKLYLLQVTWSDKLRAKKIRRKLLREEKVTPKQIQTMITSAQAKHYIIE